MMALIMAGGSGQRMGGKLPKPLVPLLGVPLIERNLQALLGAGLRRFAVSIRHSDEVTRAWCMGRGRTLVEAVGGTLQVLSESTPRGTLGIASELADTGPVLFLYGDNVFGLNWRALLVAHARTGAALTLASHTHPMPLAFGRLQLEGSHVLSYDEKPTLQVPIASGCGVMSEVALARLPVTGRCDTPTLVQHLLTERLAVHAWTHSTPWCDVNHPDALRTAEALLRQDARRLEHFVDQPDIIAVGAVLHGERGVLLERRRIDAATYPGAWDFPGGKPQGLETHQQTLARELGEELGVVDLAVQPLTTFDDLDASGRWVRHVVFEGRLDQPVKACEGQQLDWWRPTDLRPLAPPARRALAWGGF